VKLSYYAAAAGPGCRPRLLRHPAGVRLTRRSRLGVAPLRRDADRPGVDRLEAGRHRYLEAVRRHYLEAARPAAVRHRYLEAGRPEAVRHHYLEAGRPEAVRRRYLEAGRLEAGRHHYLEDARLEGARQVACRPDHRVAVPADVRVDVPRRDAAAVAAGDVPNATDRDTTAGHGNSCPNTCQSRT
jgi:hypothetical protein